MSYEVRFGQVASLPTAVVRCTVGRNDLSRAVQRGCGTAWKAVKAQGAKGGRNLAVYFDGAIRLEAGVELLSPFTPEGEVVISATPAGWVASVTHIGPYEGLGAAHAAIREWCRDIGHAPLGANWEIYGHWTDDPSELRTEVCYLTRPA